MIKTSETLFISDLIPKIVKNPQQKSLFFYFFLNFQSSKTCLMRFGIRFPEVFFEKLINVDLSSQTYIKIKELVHQLKNQQFIIDYNKKIEST